VRVRVCVCVEGEGLGGRVGYMDGWVAGGICEMLNGGIELINEREHVPLEG
jgi:hypothetical protein